MDLGNANGERPVSLLQDGQIALLWSCYGESLQRIGIGLKIERGFGTQYVTDHLALMAELLVS